MDDRIIISNKARDILELSEFDNNNIPFNEREKYNKWKEDIYNDIMNKIVVARSRNKNIEYVNYSMFNVVYRKLTIDEINKVVNLVIRKLNLHGFEVVVKYDNQTANLTTESRKEYLILLEISGWRID